MELKYFETVATCGYAADIQALLVMADKEFIPPLSARGSSTQQNLTSTDTVSDGAKAYYEAMSDQPVVVAVENGRCYGFMAFKNDYICEYYAKLPEDMPDREVYIVDAVLATGTTAVEAVNQIKEKDPKRIKFVCLLASPEGIETFSKAHPDVTIITAAVDFGLVDNRYITPGFGDAGERYFGTI